MKSFHLRLTFENSQEACSDMLAKEFKTSVLPLSSKLHRYALYYTKNEEEAQDVVQDVFLKLWKKRKELKDIENLEAFAIRMIRNKCLDLFRSSTNKTYSLEDQTPNIGNEAHGDLNKELELSESAILIRKLIGELPELQMQVMKMRDIDQLKYEEIAEITTMNINAIRVNLSRARKKVRNELLKYQGYGIKGSQANSAKIL